MTHPTSFYRSLSRVFGAQVVPTILDGQCLPLLQSMAAELGVAPATGLPQLLDVAYAHLTRSYRWEYVYKNELTRWALAQRPAATMLYEVRAANCLADCLLATGRATVAYEIKTEFDNLTRLAAQTRSYASIFDQTYVVTHAAGVAALHRHVAPETGILVLDDQLVLHEVRAAAPTEVSRFDRQQACYVLRQTELVAAHQQLLGPLPQMGTASIWDYCHRFYLGLPPATAHQVFNEALHARAVPAAQRQLFLQGPASLGVHLLRRPLPARRCKVLAALLAPAD